MTKAGKLPPIHSGEVLREYFMRPMGLSMNKLALDLHVPVTRVAEIVHRRPGVTPILHCAWPAISTRARASG